MDEPTPTAGPPTRATPGPSRAPGSAAGRRRGTGAVAAGPAGRAARAVRGGRRAATGVVLAVLALGWTPEPGAAQQLPDGVTREMVEQGRQIFRSDGFCYTCHGRDGSGTAGAGGDLTDREWRHTDGSFPQIVERIRRGVRANASTTGIPMPPAGGADLTPEEIRAVAAYVWTLSRGGG